MGWKFWQSKNNTDMEKVTEGDSRIDEHIAQELSGLKFQPVAGGKSTTLLKVEGKNGKNTILFEDGTGVDFKYLDDKYIKLGPSQKDFTPEQIKGILASRNAPKKAVPTKVDGEESLPPGKVGDAAQGLSEAELIKQSKKEAMVGDVQIDIQPTRPDSPIKQLLKKQKENLIPLNLTLKVNLPPKALFDVLIDSYNNAEEEILNFAVDKVDLEAIKQSIKESIQTNYYKTNGRENTSPTGTDGKDSVSE